MANTKEPNQYHGFSRIDKIIPQVAKQHHVEQNLDRYEVYSHWESVVTAFCPDAAGQTKPIDFRSGVLTVACLSQTAAEGITMFLDRILYALNQLLGKSLVKKLSLEL